MTLDTGLRHAVDAEEVLAVLKTKTIDEMVEALEATDAFIDAFGGKLFLSQREVVHSATLLLTQSSFPVAHLLADELVSIRRPAQLVVLAGRMIAPWLHANPEAAHLLLGDIARVAGEVDAKAELARATYPEASRPEALKLIISESREAAFEQLYGVPAEPDPT